MNTATTKLLCKQLIHEGQRLAEEEKYKEAKAKFQQSVTLYPTAEGLTYWAWMESYEGNIITAIDLCKKAISLNPEFGNAFNDIGCYLIALDQAESAIEWLEKAKCTETYDYPHYPYLNLGRLYFKLGHIEKARQEFLGALALDKHNAEARYMVTHFTSDDQYEEKTIHSKFTPLSTQDETYISIFSRN